MGRRSAPRKLSWEITGALGDFLGRNGAPRVQPQRPADETESVHKSRISVGILCKLYQLKAALLATPEGANTERMRHHLQRLQRTWASLRGAQKTAI